jgi:hypothetical protein
MSFDTPEEKREAIQNIKEAFAKVESNNALFKMNLSNFDSRAYWYNALSKEKFKRQLLGGQEPVLQEDLVLPLTTVDGRKVFTPSARRKRAATPIGPECYNLPAYKNWVEEGRTMPVQDQGACGLYMEESINNSGTSIKRASFTIHR